MIVSKPVNIKYKNNSHLSDNLQFNTNNRYTLQCTKNNRMSHAPTNNQVCQSLINNYYNDCEPQRYKIWKQKNFATQQFNNNFTIEGIQAMTEQHTLLNEQKVNANTKQRKGNQIQISQFIVQQNNEQTNANCNLNQNNSQQNNNNKIMANIDRIIQCKNQTTSLLSQVQIYVQTIQKLSKQNLAYKNRLALKQKQNKQLRDLIHLKDMEMIQFNQQNERMRRIIHLQSAKLRIIRQSYSEAELQKFDGIMRQNDNNNSSQSSIVAVQRVYQTHDNSSNANFKIGTSGETMKNQNQLRNCKTNIKPTRSKSKIKNKSENRSSPFYQISYTANGQDINPQRYSAIYQNFANISLPTIKQNCNSNSNINVSKIIQNNSCGKIVKTCIVNKKSGKTQDWNDESTFS